MEIQAQRASLELQDLRALKEPLAQLVQTVHQGLTVHQVTLELVEQLVLLETLDLKVPLD